MRKAAFTLIELLVVIVIIGLLSSIATASYLKAQSRSRDSARKSGINSIVTALEAYYSQKHSFPGDASGLTLTQSTTELGCKGNTTAFTDTNMGYSTPYEYGPDASCSLAADPTAYQPAGTWIPGMGVYLSTFPKDPRFRNSTGGQTAIDSTQPTLDFLDSKDINPIDANSQASNKTFTFFYRNLLGTNYATYARLENIDDTDFCGSPTSNFLPVSGLPTCNDNLQLANNLAGSPSSLLDPLSSIINPVASTNPISVYIIRK